MDDFFKLTAFFNENFPTLKEGVDEIIHSFEYRKLPKKNILIQSGQTENELRFIHQGLVREYYVSETKEVNIHFYESGEFVSDFLSFYTKSPTKKQQECLTETELWVLPRSQFNHWLKKYKHISLLIESYFQKILRNQEKREYHLLTKTPDEMYLHLMQKHPQWLIDIPQYHLASYLRVTPETLSRIRKRIS